METLIEYYNRYFKEFNRLAVGKYAELSYGKDTPNDTASSFESVIAYSNYIKNQSPVYVHRSVSILNAGAGASSWMLRKMFDYITCIDPNKYYLEFIQRICQEEPTINDERFELKFTPHDHVYYDYGSIERLPYLGMAIEAARKSLYIDDTDCRDCCMPYREHVIALCKEMKLNWFDCLEAKDEHGRWGIIIEK